MCRSRILFVPILAFALGLGIGWMASREATPVSSTEDAAADHEAYLTKWSIEREAVARALISASVVNNVYQVQRLPPEVQTKHRTELLLGTIVELAQTKPLAEKDEYDTFDMHGAVALDLLAVTSFKELQTVAQESSMGDSGKSWFLDRDSDAFARLTEFVNAALAHPASKYFRSKERQRDDAYRQPAPESASRLDGVGESSPDR